MFVFPHASLVILSQMLNKVIILCFLTIISLYCELIVIMYYRLPHSEATVCFQSFESWWLKRRRMDILVTCRPFPFTLSISELRPMHQWAQSVYLMVQAWISSLLSATGSGFSTKEEAIKHISILRVDEKVLSKRLQKLWSHDPAHWVTSESLPQTREIIYLRVFFMSEQGR